MSAPGLDIGGQRVGVPRERLRDLCRAVAVACEARQVVAWIPDHSGEYAVAIAMSSDGLYPPEMARWNVIALADAPLMQSLLADRPHPISTSRTPSVDGLIPAAMAVDFQPASVCGVQLALDETVGALTIEPADRIDPRQLAALLPAVTDACALVAARRTAALWAAEARLLLELNEAALDGDSLSDLLGIVCGTLARRVGVSRVSVHLLDDDGLLRPTASHRADGRVDMDKYRLFLEAPTPYPLAVEVVRTGRAITVTDPASPLIRGYWQDHFGVELAMGLPLGTAARPIGALTISADAGLRVYDDAPRLAAAAAAQLGGAIVRMKAQERQELSLAVATYARRVLDAAHAGDVDDATSQIVEGLRVASGCELAAVCLTDNSGATVTAGTPVQLLVDGELMCQPAPTAATLSAPLFVDARRPAPTSLQVLDSGVDVPRFAVLPLRPGASWHGYLVCGSHDTRLWRARDRALLTQLADQTLLALENVRLRRAEQRRVEELRVAASQDLLTGLANRRAFLRELDAALDDGERVGVLFIDLDRFKEVNDVHGHQAGDAVLQAVARVLTQAVRPTDVAARLAGDEFTVLIRELPDAVDANALAERLVSLIPLALIRTQPQCPVTASIGVAIHEGGNVSAEELLRQADHAMYASKRAVHRQKGNAVPSSRRWRDHVHSAP